MNCLHAFLEQQILVDVKDDDSYREGNRVLEVIDGKVTFNAYEE